MQNANWIPKVELKDGGQAKQAAAGNKLYTLQRANTTTHVYEQTTTNMYSYVHVSIAHHQPTSPPPIPMPTRTHTDTNTWWIHGIRMSVAYTLPTTHLTTAKWTPVLSIILNGPENWSQERCLQSLTASMDSVTDPKWFTLSKNTLQVWHVSAILRTSSKL